MVMLRALLLILSGLMLIAAGDKNSLGARGLAAKYQRVPIPFELKNSNPVEEACGIGVLESQQVCSGLNRIRTRNRVGHLKSDRHLTQVAMAYARELYEKGDLTHGDFKGRMEHAGVRNPRGENIAKGQPTPDAVLTTWSGSPGHFRNMINPAYKRVGVGYYAGTDPRRGQIYWVQIFSGSD